MRGENEYGFLEGGSQINRSPRLGGSAAVQKNSDLPSSLKSTASQSTQRADKQGLVIFNSDQQGEAGSMYGDLWAKVAARLRALLGDEVFSSWFARMQIDDVADNCVHVSVPTRFLRAWIMSNYHVRVVETFKAVDETIEDVQVSVRMNGQVKAKENKSEDANAQARKAQAPIAQGLNAKASAPRDAMSGSDLNAKFTFDQFVLGQPNMLAHAAAKQVADAALHNAVAFNPLYIHSPVGMGKTHLINAIAWAAGAGDGSRNVVYLTAEHFMYHFITAVQRQTALGFKEWLRKVDLLLIDDMQFLQGKSATEFGHCLNALVSGAKQVVIAGDRPPRELDLLDDRLRSRLAGGLVVEVGAFDYDLRRSIVQKRSEIAAQRFPDIHIPEQVLDHIARNIVSNGRDLDGAVNRLVAANQLTDEPVTVEMAERALRDLLRTRDTRKIKIEDIQRVVAKHFNVTKADLLSSRRARAVVRPRQIAMYLAKQLTPRSLPEIGRRFGGRDHTTVLHAVRKVEELMSSDGDLTNEIDLLKRMLEE